MVLSKNLTKLLLFLLLLTVNLFAIDGKIKVFIKSNDAIYTSQKITVAVELLSSAFSITDARITFPASKKYIVQAPQSASYLGQEEVNDEDWQMVHYEYEVYALQAEKIEIPSVSVSFTASMGYGQPKKEFALKSDPLHFEVKSPEGVKSNQFILVTDHYSVEIQMKPEKKKLIIGDAIELSVSQKAKGIPDLLLRPVVYESNAFVRVYDKEPELKREPKRDFDVSRTDRFTFVASGEGNVTLPAQKILWYNSKSKQIHVEKIPLMKFEILPDPQIAIDAKKAQQKQLLLYVGLVLLFVVSLYLLFAQKIAHYRKERMRLFKESEAGKFAALQRAVKSGDVVVIDRQYYPWLLSINPELVRGGMKAIETIQPSFTEILKELNLAVGDSEHHFDKMAFMNELKTFRSMLLEDHQGTEQSLPRNINPVVS